MTINIEEAKRRARAGTALLFGRRLMVVALTFISTLTIARLLPPEAFGLANMSSVLLALAMVFRDFGLTSAMMRKNDIDEEELSFVFWANAAITLVFTAILAALAPIAADFYHEPVVMWVMLCSLIGFFVSGVTLQHVALMNRNLRFAAVALIDIVALLVGFITTLVLAFVRGDVWAIVLGTLAQLVTSAVLFVLVSGWRPTAPRRPADLGSLLRFGANTSLYSLSTFLSNNVLIIVIGHVLGAPQLGQFNRAQALYQLPVANIIQPLAQATMPLLTRLSSHPGEYRAAYLRLIRQLCVFLFPLAITLSIAAVPTVEALLGPKWHLAGEVLAVLALSLTAHVFGYSAGDLFITQDRSAELRTLGLIELVFRVGSILVLVSYGLVPAAIGFTASTIGAASLRMVVAGRKGPVTQMDQLGAAATGLPLAAGAAIACLAVSGLMPGDWPSVLRASCLLVAGGLGALALGLVFGASRRALAELGDAVGVLRVYGLVQRRLRPVRSPIDPVS